MALNDLIRNITVVAGLALVPASLGCEGDEGDTKNYYGSEGGSRGGDICDDFKSMCPSQASDYAIEHCKKDCVYNGWTDNDCPAVACCLELSICDCNEDSPSVKLINECIHDHGWSEVGRKGYEP